MKKTNLALLLFAPLRQLREFGGDLLVEEVGFVESRHPRYPGRSYFPENQRAHAAVVFDPPGSGKQTRNLDLAKRFAQGRRRGAEVYDKRGAGKSGGEYEGEQSVSEMNIALLARDAASALEKLFHPSFLERNTRGICGHQSGRMRLAPVAAERSRLAKFLLLWSSPVGKVSEEDIYSKYTSDRG